MWYRDVYLFPVFWSSNYMDSGTKIWHLACSQLGYIKEGVMNTWDFIKGFLLPSLCVATIIMVWLLLMGGVVKWVISNF